MESSTNNQSSPKDEDWSGWVGYMAAKNEKLNRQFKQSASAKSGIFKGVVICVNGYTVPSADVLRRLMQEHGGMYVQYPSSAVTHIIASNLAQSKIVKLGKEDLIVRPQWITDSIQVGRLLSCRSYLLYNKPDKCMAKYLKSVGPQGSRQLPVSDGFDSGGRSDFDGDSFDSDLGEAEVTNDNAHIAPEILPKVAKHNNIEPTTSSRNKSISTSRAIPKTCDPNFLSEFYSHSRLHFISTLALEMKDYVRRIKLENCSSFPGKQRILASQQLIQPQTTSSNWQRVIMHIDMDCFFVSVGIRDKPDLKGKPVAVTHSKGCGPSVDYNKQQNFTSFAEIASCSYEARAHGLKNGMLLGDALKRCPNLHVIYYNFDEYRAVSRLLYDTIAEYTLAVEAVSCDELYVDLTGLSRELLVSVESIVESIRNDIINCTRCPVSAGVGPDMLVARLATRKAKPNGQCFVQQSNVQSFILTQDLEDLPGIGPSTVERLHAMSIRSCGDLQIVPLTTLQTEFGSKTGQLLYNFCRGLDDRKLKGDIVRKSVSCDVNYGIRFQEEKEVHMFLDNLSVEVSRRLKEAFCRGQLITLKLLIRASDAPVETRKFLGCGHCDAVNRSVNLPSATNSPETIACEIKKLVKQISPVVADIRGVGVTVQKLKSDVNTIQSPLRIENFFKKSANTVDISNKRCTDLSPRKNPGDKSAASVCSPQIQLETVRKEVPSKTTPNDVQTSNNSTTIAVQNLQGAALLRSKRNALHRLAEKRKALVRRSQTMSSKGSSRQSRLDSFYLVRKSPLSRREKSVTLKRSLQIRKTNPQLAPINNSAPTALLETDAFCWPCPVLCGYSHLNGVDKLLQQWTSVGPDLGDTDCRIFTGFLTEFIESMKLDQLYAVLKILKRLLCSSNSESRSSVYSKICSELQSRILLQYGIPLRLP